MEEGASDGIRQPVVTTSMSRPRSAINKEDDDKGTRTGPTVQLNEISKIDDPYSTGMGSITRLDELSQLSETSIDTDSTQLDDLDSRFLCALKATDAMCQDDSLEAPFINSADFEHVFSDISLVNYAQELASPPGSYGVGPELAGLHGRVCDMSCTHRSPTCLIG